MNEEFIKIGLYNISYMFDKPLIKPKVLQLSLTSRCNLKCKMCAVHKYTTRPEEEMKLEEINKIIGVARERFGVDQLILTGGEPLLIGERIIDVIRYAAGKGIAVYLTTNGYLLEKYALDLVKAGVSHFHVSIDGLKETHNRIRGDDSSFDRAVAGLKALVDLRGRNNYGYNVVVATLVLKNNIDELYELYKYADEIGADVFDLLSYIPDNTDFGSTDFTALWPDSGDIDRFLEVHKRICSQKTKRIKMNNFFDIDFMSSYYRRQMHELDWKCFAGYKNIFITMSDPKKQGRFEPCLFLCKAHIPLRDYDYDLEKIWYSPEVARVRAEIKKCKINCYQMCFSFPSLKQMLKP